MSNELKIASLPIYRGIHEKVGDAEDIIGTEHFEAWFEWFFEEPSFDNQDEKTPVSAQQLKWEGRLYPTLKSHKQNG